MLAAYAVQLGLADPLDGLIVRKRPEPQAPPGWVVVSLTHAAVNPQAMCEK